MRWVMAVAAVLLALFTTGCGLIDGSANNVGQGDCLKKSGDEGFDKVSCSASDAGFVVLDRAGSGKVHDRCVDVPGTEYVYTDKGSGSICVGIKGADPARAANAAQKGDCLTDTKGGAVQKAPCTDPTAVYRVLARPDGSEFMTDSACKNVAGTQTTYSYLLKAKKGIGAFGTGIVFCLIAKDSDATRTIDNAKVGDCLKKTGANDVEITGCTAPDAKYKILSSVFDKSLCDRVAGSIASYSYQQAGEIMPKVYCLGSPH
ncbi:LppU/SCO3897 family protein [Nocardia tengchongensis]